MRAEFARHAETGAFFQSKQLINFSAKVLGMVRNRGVQEQAFYGHQRFQAESTLVTP